MGGGGNVTRMSEHRMLPAHPRRAVRNRNLTLFALFVALASLTAFMVIFVRVNF